MVGFLTVYANLIVRLDPGSPFLYMELNFQEFIVKWLPKGYYKGGGK